MRLSITIQENRLKLHFWLIILSILVFIAGFYPDFVENWYAQGIYPPLSILLRSITSWVNWSVGDLFYIIIILYVLVKIWRLTGIIYKKQFNWTILFRCFGYLLRWGCFSYILFNILWGFNYHRKGIGHQLAIQQKPYSKEALTDLTNHLIERSNYYRKSLGSIDLEKIPFDQIKTESIKSYRLIENKYPFLQYETSSIKSTSFNSLADYIGFTGYYNPFTGEAQLRTDMPSLLLPFTTCHEMAHQLGYASESEASFVGFLTASTSSNYYFRYAAYLEILDYALRQQFILYAKDSNFKEFEAVIQYNKSHIDTLVKKDRKEIRQFFNQRRNQIAPISAGLYDQYLKFNQQLAGINSYDEVIGWLIAYKYSRGQL